MFNGELLNYQRVIMLELQYIYKYWVIFEHTMVDYQ